MATSSVVRVEGDVGGQIIVGDHNVVISAQYGSTAVLRPEAPPPVRRRERPAGRTLRRRPVTLFGREGELATVDQWLGDGHVVQVYGPPGIGKSSLLRRYAAGRSALDRDIVFLPAAGLPVEDVIQELFHACFDTEGYKPEHSRVRRLMGAVQALLVVDDFEGSPKDLAALADAAPGCDLLVAAVDRCVSDEVRTLRLGGLSEDAALDLVARELGRTPEGAERDAVRDLVGTVDGHPLTLVQMSAAVRAAEVSGEEHADGAFTAGETALAVGVAGRLDDVAVRLLRVLFAVSPLPVSSGLLYALAGDVGPSAGACAAEVLEQSHLIEQVGSGYHSRCDLASRVVRHTGRVPEAGELAAGLTDWLRTGTTRQEAAAEAAVIGRVLADAARRGDHAAVRDLARAAAPVLARSLHWGSWRSVLEHGRAAAAALGSAADEAYFAHEEEVRRKALGLAAAVVVTAAGGGVGAGAAAVHNALAAGGKSTTATGKAGLGALASKPAVIATAVAALISAGVFVALADTGGGQPAADPPPAPAVSVYGPHSPPPQPRTSPPWPSAPEPSVPSPSASPPTPVPRLSLPGNSGGCVPAPMPAPDFGRSRTHERTTRQVDFDAWLPCDDEKSLDVTDKQNWAVALTACPPPQGSRLCRFAVTFQPSSPGTHHATVTIHDDWGHDDLSMEVTGVAVDAASSTPVAPSVRLEPSDPVSPTRSTRTPRPGRSEPLPSTT